MGNGADAVGSRVPRDRAIYELRIKDNGLGMSRDFVKRMFDPFERERVSSANSVEGTGLGMPITKGIVTLMGGTIEVESEKDKGTEIIVRLPMPFADANVANGKGQNRLQTANGNGSATPSNHVIPSKTPRRLLLVEDNDINREIAYTLLSQSGFAVDQAEDGQIAIEKFSRGGPGFYDAILMDVHMPIMDGYLATRTIRAMELPNGPRVPIIALSANAFESDVKAALKAGMDAHIAKPIKIPLLLKTLEEVMNRTTATLSGRPATLSGGPAVAPASMPADLLSALSEMGCNVSAALRDTYMDDKAFYLKMLSRLPESNALARMRDALTAGNPSAFFSASHNLKGLYASLGLTSLHELCREMVEISRAGGLDGVAESLARLEKMHKSILGLIAAARDLA